MKLKKFRELIQKVSKNDRAVKWILILGICGVALIYFSSWVGPNGEEEKKTGSQVETSQSYKEELEKDLLRIVKAITGEENPVIMVTLENNGKRVYAQNEKTSAEEAGESQESEKTHVILKDQQGDQNALPVTETEPQVKGVVVVSRFAGDPAIREKLTKAVRTALHVSSAKVCVTDSG